MSSLIVIFGITCRLFLFPANGIFGFPGCGFFVPPLHHTGGNKRPLAQAERRESPSQGQDSGMSVRHLRMTRRAKSRMAGEGRSAGMTLVDLIGVTAS